jgi:hypothetical protein
LFGFLFWSGRKPNVNISPQSVLLTSGQAVTFEAVDTGGQPVSWTLNPPIGTLATPANGTQAPSATYVAPPLVSSAQTIALIASTGNESASATISLTADAIAIVPAKVDLKADQSQQFVAILATAPVPMGSAREETIWILSPPLGTLEQTGLYKAPHEIPESTTINIIATTPTLGKQAVAVINLASPPWQGFGVQLLGGYLLLVFSLVFLMLGLWPPSLPSPDTARVNRIDAEKALDDATTRLETKAKAAEDAASQLQVESNKQVQSTGTPGTKAGGNAASLETAKAKAISADDAFRQAKETRDFAQKDLSKKRSDEETVNAPNVHTKLAGKINRELDLLLLVLLAGSLGSFLHIAQSYSEFIGNRTIKSSWAWWYSFRPFIGAGLALVFYAAVRGGFMAVSTGSNAKATELNPFGLVSVGAMVGMFSKAATVKLGEVFDTVFKAGSTPKSKDPVVAETSNQSAGKAAAGGTAASTTK